MKPPISSTTTFLGFTGTSGTSTGPSSLNTATLFGSISIPLKSAKRCSRARSPEIKGSSDFLASSELISARIALAPRMYIRSPSMIPESCCADSLVIRSGLSSPTASAIASASLSLARRSSRWIFAVSRIAAIFCCKSCSLIST
ncbi:hypothetical protein D9M69_558180 [compost metagenome]